MAFLDLDSPPRFANSRAGATVRVHEDWLTASEFAAPAPTARWKRIATTVAALAIAAGVHFWSAAALDSHLLGLATTGVVAAMALSLLTGVRR